MTAATLVLGAALVANTSFSIYRLKQAKKKNGVKTDEVYQMALGTTALSAAIVGASAWSDDYLAISANVLPSTPELAITALTGIGLNAMAYTEDGSGTTLSAAVNCVLLGGIAGFYGIRQVY